MSSLKSIVKNLGASFSSHFVSVLQQVALTPVFLHSYGEAGFGEWLTLSASVSYLVTLDFGIQTYVNQDLTVRYHRGDMDDFHTQQSTALRLLLGITLSVALLALVVFAMPLEHWLRMDGSASGPAIPGGVVRGTVYLLAMQMLGSILFGFFAGEFMIVGRAHIGQYWQNIKNAAQILFALPCLLLHANFMIVALAQLVALMLCMVGVLITLYRVGRDIFPTLRYWDGASVRPILSHSGYFALIISSNFLVYQVPILMLQRFSGPVAVAIFSITRTIFSMTRNLMNSLTQSMGPEVTRLYARDDWRGLSKLYDYSERLVFALIPIANVGTLFLCPLLLTLWLHKPSMFVLPIYVLCATVSVVMSAKEHKYQFQVSTNTHQALGRFMFLTYLGLVSAWLLVVPRFGVLGLLWAWLAVEVLQMLYIMRLNQRFFGAHEVLDIKYPIRLTLLSLACLVATMYTIPHTLLLSRVAQAGLAVALGFLLLGVEVPIFGLVPVWGSLRGLLQRRLARAA